jgi:hypothetical protein
MGEHGRHSNGSVRRNEDPATLERLVGELTANPMADGVAQAQTLLDHGCQIGELFESRQRGKLPRVWDGGRELVMQPLSYSSVGGNVIGGPT